MSQRCAMCGENPASVFREDHPICKPCLREVRRQEQEDNRIVNVESCGRCGGVAERGHCGWCEAQDIRYENEWKLAHS